MTEQMTNHNIAYLDHCATTPLYPAVADKIKDILDHEFGNPSSLHCLGRRAQDLLEEARGQAAKVVGAVPAEISFNSCATEGNNQVLRSFAGGHIITTATEHPSVRRTLETMAAEGSEVTVLPVDGQGRIDLDQFKASLRKDTALVSIMHVNNETGCMNDLGEIGRIIREKGGRTRFHSDCVQSFLKFPLDVKALNLDFLTASAHKVHGPKGIGVLYVRKGLKPKSLIQGGGQEGGLRAGTQNVPYIAGFGQACLMLLPELENNRNKVEAFKHELLGWFQENDDAGRFRLNGALEDFSPFVLNVSFKGLRAEILLRLLEEKGVLVSTGSACSAKTAKDSPVLTAMGLNRDEIMGSIRICFSDTNSEHDIEMAKQGFRYALDFAGRKSK